MLNIELNHQEITGPGLYIMRWKKQTGLVRIVGQPRTGYKIINPEGTPESYIKELPVDGQIPNDAYFSEPLAIVVV